MVGTQDNNKLLKQFAWKSGRLHSTDPSQQRDAANLHAKENMKAGGPSLALLRWIHQSNRIRSNDKKENAADENREGLWY